MANIDISDLNLPYNLDAEQAVIGSVIVTPESYDVIAKLLSPNHFREKLHKELFSVIMQMQMLGKDVNIVTVIEQALRQGIFDNQEDAKTYIMRLVELAISPSSIESYAKIIEEKYMMRQLMMASKEIYDKSSSGTEEPDALLDFAETQIYGIRSDRTSDGLIHIKNIITNEVQNLMTLCENPKSTHGLSTSFPSLDKCIFGLNPSDLIILAARPGVGKTSFATNIGVNVAKRYRDKSICIFSLEMSREQIVNRILSSEARITSDEMKTGRISADKWRRIGETVDILRQLNIYIDDTSSITINEMKSQLRRMSNVGLVIIDYLQLMSTGRRSDGNRVNEVSEITRNLKIMAKDLNVPVITLSQLSRASEQRPDKHPMLSDLRDSGSIEQDADIVMFLYREAYHDNKSPNPNSCECMVAKNRHGETTNIPLYWNGEYTRFSEVDNNHEE